MYLHGARSAPRRGTDLLALGHCSIVMSSETATSTVPETRFDWQGGAAAGLIAGAVMDAMLTVMLTPVIQRAWRCTDSTVSATGWLAHLFHSAAFDVVFAALAGAAGIGDDRVKSAGVGVAYGVVLAAIVMPIWLGAAGVPGALDRGESEPSAVRRGARPRRISVPRQGDRALDSRRRSRSRRRTPPRRVSRPRTAAGRSAR